MKNLSISKNKTEIITEGEKTASCIYGAKDCIKIFWRKISEPNKEYLQTVYCSIARQADNFLMSSRSKRLKNNGCPNSGYSLAKEEFRLPEWNCKYADGNSYQF